MSQPISVTLWERYHRVTFGNVEVVASCSGLQSDGVVGGGLEVSDGVMICRAIH